LSANTTLSEALGSNVSFTNDAFTVVAAVAAATGVVQSSSGAGATLSVSYDAASGSYTVSDSSHAATFAPADLHTGVAGQPYFSHADGSQLTLYTRLPSSQVFQTYSGLGVWTQPTTSGGVQTTTYDTFTYGNPTPAAATPRTGAGNYAIDLVAYLATPGVDTKSLAGSGRFTVDFLDGGFNADIFPTETGLVSGQSLKGGFEFVAGGALSSSGSTFSGEAAYVDTAPTNNGLNVGATYAGPISGRFYGPSAQEVGASFTGSNANGGSMVGSFFGSQAGPASVNADMANIVVAETFDVIDVSQSHIPGSNGSAGNISIDQLAVTPGGNFTLTHAAGLSFLQDVAFRPANIVAPAMPNFTTYNTMVDGTPAQLDVYKPGAANSELALTYMDLGLWRTAANPPQYTSDEASAFLFGLLTPDTVLSGLSGSAHYTGVAYGQGVDDNASVELSVTGTSSFDVNFSSHTLSGSLALNGTPLGGGASQSYGDFSFSGAMPINNSSPGNAGIVANQINIIHNGTNAGWLQPQFFGPTAQEVGAAFQLAFDTPDHLVAIAGVAAAKRR
jgi:hypothetical protein